MPHIPIGRPALGDEEIAAVVAVLRSGRLVQGREVAAFEDEFSAEVAGRPCVALSSGTAAVHLALAALDIGRGDEVILPSFTFAGTANAVRLAGATPVFADVCAADFCLDPADVAARCGPRTAAVVAVHLYGQMGEMTKLAEVCNRRGLALIEDAAQAHGAHYGDRPAGTIGDSAAFSFYATKNMTTGEGGMVVLRDAASARAARLLRNQGMPDHAYNHEVVGFNARMTDIAATIGRVQLRRLPGFLAARRRNADRYDKLLWGLVTPTEAAGRTHAWHQYTLRLLVDRDRVATRLRRRGVEAGVYYPTPVHRLPAFAVDEHLPVTELLAGQVLSMPVHPNVSDRDLEEAAEALRESVG